MQRSALCRSRRELSNAYLLTTFGFDPAENEPCKVWPIEGSMQECTRTGASSRAGGGAGARAGRDQGGRRVRPGGHGRGRVRAGHLTIFPQFSWYIFEFGAVPFSSSGGRLPAALFMVFQLDSKGAKALFLIFRLESQGAKACTSCRSRQDSRAFKQVSTCKIGVDTTENEPLKVCQQLGNH